jgi:hypothetical protein
MADEQPGEVMKVFGRTGSPPCYVIREFLYRNDVRMLALSDTIPSHHVAQWRFAFN